MVTWNSRAKKSGAETYTELGICLGQYGTTHKRQSLLNVGGNSSRSLISGWPLFAAVFWYMYFIAIRYSAILGLEHSLRLQYFLPSRLFSRNGTQMGKKLYKWWSPHIVHFHDANMPIEFLPIEVLENTIIFNSTAAGANYTRKPMCTFI